MVCTTKEKGALRARRGCTGARILGKRWLPCFRSISFPWIPVPTPLSARRMSEKKEVAPSAAASSASAASSSGSGGSAPQTYQPHSVLMTGCAGMYLRQVRLFVAGLFMMHFRLRY